MLKNNNNILVLKNFIINIRIEKVLAYLRFNKSISNLDKNFEVYLLKEINKFYQIINTVGIYRIEDKSDCVFLYENSLDVKNLLSGCDKVAVFAVSIGNLVDEKIEFLLNDIDSKDVMKAAVFDAIGSEAVEQCANYVNNFVAKKFLVEDFVMTKRYSAGYGDWNILGNFKIFEFLELEKFGIKIDQSGLLYPQKTITAIAGLKQR